MNTFASPKGHALIVAIANYSHVRALPVAVLNDAKAMAEVFSSPQYCGFEQANIIQLLDEGATREAVLSGLDDLRRRAQPEDIVCVYFSGHGALTGKPDESSLLTVDSSTSDLINTSVSAFELSNALKRIEARRLIVFLDACHAAGAGTLKDVALSPQPIFGVAEKTLSQLAEGAGRALMASCRSSESSLIMPGAQNSAFTEALLEALKGKADKLKEGVVRVFDLFDYVSRTVPITTREKQHPIFKAAELENNFPVSFSKVADAAVSERLPLDDGTALELMSSVLPMLYPLGPCDQNVWERAGGDLSLLRLQGTGRTMWFSALKLLELGGGGVNITIRTLFGVVTDDFPNNPELSHSQASR
jgi:hypothetical protein